MLSPVKLYKHDMANQRVARTWGPKGKPYGGCKGSYCYTHKNLDWSVHRLTPAIYEHAKPGGKVRSVISKGTDKISGGHVRRPGLHLKQTSPRWGQGKVPSRMEGRHVVPLPKKSSVEVGTGTKIAVGVGAAAGVGYGIHKAHQHFAASHQQHTDNTIRKVKI